ncbi:MAG: hypothetical protein DRI65_12845 [Chloroflexota bacterium]|nr:MAG: hypothetical protein DRI65_12845 [Chloroflexota bacterium]
MLRLNEEQVKSLSSLKQSPAFYKFIQLLEDELEVNIKGLITSKDVTLMHQMQGKSQLLSELIRALQD